MDAFPFRDPGRHIWVQSTRPADEGRLGSLFALANGLLGLRGSPEECPSWGRPGFYVAGAYAGGPPSLLGFHDPDHVLTHPDRITRERLEALDQASIWTLPNLPFPIAVRLAVGGEAFDYDRAKVLSNERLLDMARGVVQRCLVFRDRKGRRTRVDAVRFVSMADRNLVCLRYRVRPLGHDAEVDVAGRLHADESVRAEDRLWHGGASRQEDGLTARECILRETGAPLAVAQRGEVRQADEATVLDLFAVAGAFELESACKHATAAAGKGFDELLRAHEEAFRADQEAGRVEVDETPAFLQGFRLGQMHLAMACGPETRRAGIPIKGLTGPGYRFLNFWDTDFHMFPYYLMTRPGQARELLVYRYDQLDAYRANACAWGARGAQVPWETSTRGCEETAPWLCLQEREIHISADAARMFWLYDQLTPDREALATMGAEFAFETARFYASRLRWVPDKKAYDLPDIGCPDQYHTFADNNVFISRMAKWNLEWAVELAADPALGAARERVDLSQDEVATWKEMASKFSIIGPDADGILEEFEGFFDLDPDLDGICETYCQHSQAVKQPDVLAAFGPFEDLYSEEVRRQNWHFYNARTLHGSSLSFPGMAYAAARCGLNDEALYHLSRSTRMDLDDVNQDAEKGIHVSGGAVEWQAVVFGFGGVTPKHEHLRVRPNLPRQWRFLAFRLHWQLQRLRMRITPETIVLEADAANERPVVVKPGDAEPVEVVPGARREVSY